MHEFWGNTQKINNQGIDSQKWLSFFCMGAVLHLQDKQDSYKTAMRQRKCCHTNGFRGFFGVCLAVLQNFPTLSDGVGKVAIQWHTSTFPPRNEFVWFQYKTNKTVMVQQHSIPCGRSRLMPLALSCNCLVVSCKKGCIPCDSMDW